jgi:steroid 5-alpha reductase family enzyme
MLLSYLVITGVTVGFFTFFYLLSVVLKDASIVDIAWGLGFIVIAATGVVFHGAHPVLVVHLILVTIWGLRLSGHIFFRKLKHAGEDFRYANWRKNWGHTFWWRSFLQVFLLQSIVMLVIALPIIIAAERGSEKIGPWTVIGVAIWLLGFLCESIADAQLTAFKKDASNKGKLMMSGFWKYSRHPNYFGEAVQWWGIWVIALAVPGAWWTVIGPVAITYFLRFVSGVPMLERKYAGREDFEQYKKRTHAFVPWLSKDEGDTTDTAS